MVAEAKFIIFESREEMDQLIVNNPALPLPSPNPRDFPSGCYSTGNVHRTGRPGLRGGPLDPIIGGFIFNKIAHSPREHLHISTQQKPSTVVDFGIDREEQLRNENISFSLHIYVPGWEDRSAKQSKNE
jgi:hypothetical protein